MYIGRINRTPHVTSAIVRPEPFVLELRLHFLAVDPV